ncbi:unnamed protein product [Durusdinium trenchii]|uniref:DNA-directed RNA polymerase n=1 Tax=Durusdinium trenchii TaxID=1381693 RepID=A0ABP0I8U7_9DINO
MKLGEIINLVLPNALYKAEGDDGYFVRETIHNIMAYDKDGKTSKERKKLVKHMKKELGMSPFGSMPIYSMSEQCPREIAQSLNSRERESLDIHWASLHVTWQLLSLG